MSGSTQAELEKLLDERILVLDGAMGTTIRGYGLDEAAARGERFKDNHEDLLNNGDILTLTRPDIIGDIHKRFYEAGSDIVETNTFSGTAISQSDFFVAPPADDQRKDPEFYQAVVDDSKLRDLAWELNFESAQLCRTWADNIGSDSGRRRFVAGAIGPLTVSLSVSPDAEDPGFRTVTFDQVHGDYKRQVRALIAGGVDILMVETIFDSLNAKAALVAIQEVLAEDGVSLPIIISAAVGKGGDTLISGQDILALWAAVRNCKPLAIGLNCSLGPDLMRPSIEALSAAADTYISAYPNAGLPDPLSPTGFPYSPEDMEGYTDDFAASGFINLVGGCCGNTPEHIAAIARAAERHAPRAVPKMAPFATPASADPAPATA